MTLQPATPAELTASVLTAVIDGAWTSSDVAATVTAETQAPRSEVIATLWDLVDEGTVVYDGHAAVPGFRVAPIIF